MTEDLSELTDEEQVALIAQTNNSLSPEDEAIEQPPQDPNYIPEGSVS